MRKNLYGLLVFFSLIHCVAVAQYKPFVSNDVFQTQFFIENKGQFNAILKDQSDIDFAVNHGHDEIYLNKKGFKYYISKATPHKETAEEQRKEKLYDSHEEEEDRLKYDVEEDWFILEWIGANEKAEKLQFEKSKHYFTYGSANYNSYGYKTIGYRNIYPGIDIEYALHEKGGIEYTLILKPNANLNDVKFKYSSRKGVQILNKKNSLIIENNIGKIIESNIKAYYPNGQEVPLQYEVDAHNIVRFKPIHIIDKAKGLIIDPWVIANTTLTGITSCNNMAYDVDFDLSGSLVAIGGGGNFGAGNSNLPKLAKYDNLGNLVWTFSGNIVTPVWSSSPNVNGGGVYGCVGNFTSDKISSKLYISQGWNSTSGASVVRLNPNGNYDNFITTPNAFFQEIWEMKFDCTSGKILGMGGSTNSSLNFGILDTTSGVVATTNITGITATHLQDIVCAAIDGNGEMYTIFVSNTTSAVNNKIFKLNANNTSNIWSSFSGYNDFEEGMNKIYVPTPFGYSNGFNALTINANYLFYYDGIHLKAFDKSNGAVVGSPITIAGQVSKQQGGIYANDCNEVFVGGNNGDIKKYLFNGAAFVAQGVLVINGYAGKSVYDIVQNPLNNLLYACGNGFVASIDPQSSCPTNSSIGNIQLSYTVQCPDSALVSILNPLPNTAYTYIWIDSNTNTTLQTTTLPVGITSQGLSGLIPGHTIKVNVFKSSACQVVLNTISIFINCTNTFINIAKCSGDSIYLSNNMVYYTPGIYTDTLTSILNQDSVVFINFINYPTYSTTNNITLCQGQSYTLPSNTIVSVAGTYVDSLNTVNGCDSIITTVLTLATPYSISVTDTICANQSYTLPSNIVVNTSGTYIDSLLTINSCDSIITTHLVVNPIQLTTIYDTICAGNNYTLPDNSIVTTTGIYTNHFTNQFGCDSTIIVHLQVYPLSSTTNNTILCQGQSYTLPNNTIVTTSGTYVNTFNTIHGCDSIITSVLTFLTPYSISVLDTICANQSYTLPSNIVVNTSGTYIDSFLTINSCDSIITTHLVVNPIQLITIYDTICAGNNYMLPDNSIVTTTGIYNNTFTNQFGCDSTIIVHLQVQPTIYRTENVSLCNQTSYILPNGNSVSTNGTYISNLLNPSGCDSVITTNLEFNFTKYTQTNVNICENKSYTLPDNSVVNVAGTYSSTILTSKGCDSIITTKITLTTLPKVDLGKDTMLCENASIRLDVYNLNSTYLWSDQSSRPYNILNSTGIFYVDVTRPPCEAVRDSIEILDCPCNVFIPNAFSPNNDTKNDIFKPTIQCVISPEDYSFKVFNKWGQQVFFTTLQDDGWDGTFFQVQQSIGTFMYLLQFKNPKTDKMETYKGDVTLVR